MYLTTDLNLKWFNKRQDMVNWGLPIHSQGSRLGGPHRWSVSSPSLMSIIQSMPRELDKSSQPYELSSKHAFIHIIPNKVYGNQQMVQGGALAEIAEITYPTIFSCRVNDSAFWINLFVTLKHDTDIP